MGTCCIFENSSLFALCGNVCLLKKEMCQASPYGSCLLRGGSKIRLLANVAKFCTGKLNFHTSHPPIILFCIVCTSFSHFLSIVLSFNLSLLICPSNIVIFSFCSKNTSHTDKGCHYLKNIFKILWFCLVLIHFLLARKLELTLSFVRWRANPLKPNA